MAVNDHTDHRDPESGTARDPRLARLLEAAGREEPPSALDAAILAAARKEAGARPLSVPGGGGAGSAGSAPVRAKRNWYVPVSIAAVLVLSVSMVTLVQQEKGDELAQPPRATNVPPPSAAQAPAAVPAPAKLAEEKRTTQAKTAAVPESHADAAQKQRKDKIVVTADSATALGSARRDQVSEATTQAPVPGVVASVKSVPESVAGTGAASAPAPELERRAEPLPAVRERDASAVLSKPATAAPAPPSRSEATPAPSRSEATPAPLATAPAAPAAAPQVGALRRSMPMEDAQVRSAPAPAQADGRVFAPPPPAPKLASPPPPRPPVWRGLEDQPPEKWLERLAEFKRDNRAADAEALLAEFRRRFPDHPGAR